MSFIFICTGNTLNKKTIIWGIFVILCIFCLEEFTGFLIDSFGEDSKYGSELQYFMENGRGMNVLSFFFFSSLSSFSSSLFSSLFSSLSVSVSFSASSESLFSSSLIFAYSFVLRFFKISFPSLSNCIFKYTTVPVCVVLYATFTDFKWSLFKNTVPSSESFISIEPSPVILLTIWSVSFSSGSCTYIFPFCLSIFTL